MPDPMLVINVYPYNNNTKRGDYGDACGPGCSRLHLLAFILFQWPPESSQARFVFGLVRSLPPYLIKMTALEQVKLLYLSQ